MTRVLMCVGRDVDMFLTPETVAQLGREVKLTVRNGLENDEDAYALAIQQDQAEVVITGWHSPLLTVGVMDENPQLKYMCHLTGGVRTNVQREAIERGLMVTNWGTQIGQTVAEAALMGILNCLRRTTAFTFMMHQDKGWRGKEKAVRSLFERRVGLHGFGNVARTLVELLRPFGCKVSAYDPYVKDEVFAKHGVRRVATLKTLYAENDVVSIHAPKIPETERSVNAEILAAMPDGAVLVNTARGAIIDTAALEQELKTGRISASLDVYEPEPLPADSPMRGLPNCHLTCHTAGPTPDRMFAMGEEAMENIRRFMRGEPLQHVVTVEQYDLMT
ncbi:MAG: hydroxyacid dehydrogenase [bacterium]|nr:hydroxyacid dehydrogenase [bacterium]